MSAIEYTKDIGENVLASNFGREPSEDEITSLLIGARLIMSFAKLFPKEDGDEKKGLMRFIEFMNEYSEEFNNNKELMRGIKDVEKSLH